MPSRPLPANSNPSFLPDYAGAIVYPAHPTNIYYPEHRDWPHRGVPNIPRAIVLHTPEEDADDWETTPAYFAGANRQASTHYYLDDDADVFQCVSERCGAIANGLLGMAPPSFAIAGMSLNYQTVSIEIEGRAASIAGTLIVDGPQWNKLVDLCRDISRRRGIPLDRTHVVGHYQLANNRTDPGPLFPWDALMSALKAPEPTAPQRRKTGMYIIGLEGPAPDAYLVIPAPMQPPYPDLVASSTVADRDPQTGGRTYLIPDRPTYEDLYAMIYGTEPREIRQTTWDWLHSVVGFERLI